ncbi:hypothetical protein MRB53_012360 [Persea americana]|uniref:Uncharacterized protein n=1 Tax=Persea americana TaxID=3435 RepID=A0ACC2LXK2_PERAE|nr:hypothetical protein MRB53_012360 [Persea americana]
MDLVLVVEIATDDTYDGEEVVRVVREAVSSKVSDDMNSSTDCAIWLPRGSGMAVTRRCSHRECIERWLLTNQIMPDLPVSDLKYASIGLFFLCIDFLSSLCSVLGFYLLSS